MTTMGGTDQTATVATTTPTGAGRAQARPARRRPRPIGKWAELLLLLGPALVLFVGFVLAPIGVAAYYGFFHWTGFTPRTWNGLANYDRAVHDTVFTHAILHNAIIAVLSVVIQLPISIAIAMMLNRRMRGRGVLRLLVFAPYVLSEATTAVVWSLMLQASPNEGLIDHLLRAVGLGVLVHNWLGSTHLVLYTLFVVLTWKYIGFGITLLLAGLQNIPQELREAAAIDGATAWNTTRHIVLPLLGPTIRIWIFLSVIGSLQLFDINWIIIGGGPANASSTMAIYLYQHGLSEYQFGYGSAIAVILFLICFVFALLYQNFVLRRDTEGALTRMVG